jgi:DNA-binding GntR family transcriptional regulator
MKSIIKSEPLHLQSYRIIKEGILTGDHASGHRITELGLSRELGVSRGTIREAVKMLIQDGLLVQRDGNIYIFEPTLEVAVDLYLCREKLESLAAKLAARNILPSQKEELKIVLEKTKEALLEGNRPLIIKLNTEFHEKIINFSNNQELKQLMNVIRSKIICLRNSVQRNYARQDDFILEHEAIAGAIISGDELEAESAMSLHIQNDLKAIHKLFEDN